MPMAEIKKRFIPGVLAVSLCFIGAGVFGCAYFNTFYLAKRNYKDGERFRKRDNEVVQGTKKYYNNAIENCAMIIRDYKDSKYVDDSLFIMGMSYYHMRDFVQARIKFNELLSAFPQSGYIADARYYRARCFMELDQADQARIDLNELVVSGSRSMRGKAGLVLAEIQNRAEQWDELIATADKIIASDPENNVFCEAMLYKGEGLFRLEKFKETVETFHKLQGKNLKPALRFKVNSRISFSLAKLGNYDEALKYLESMQGKGEFAVYAPNIRLEMGKILELKGETDRAVEAYRTMAADYPDSVAGREAWYRVGVITLEDISKADEAKDAFVKVTQNKKVDEIWFLDAKEKAAQIDSLKARSDRIDKLQDNPVESAHERFLLAELLTFSLDHPEEALNHYNKILEEAPESEYAVRSEFMIGISGLEKNGALTDETEKEVMRKVVQKYPESQFSQELKVRLGIIDVPPDKKLLREAEDARLNDMEPDVYIPLYQAVVDSFPQTESGYQARFVIAWSYEHDKGDLDKALELYRTIAAESQNEFSREYVNLASNKLNLVMDEEKIIEDSKKNIAYYESEIESNGHAPVQISGPSASIEENGFSEMKKIRARNARIRTKYYSD